jgi:RNA polymerase sigma-70 factor (ECF subfamily)
MASDRELLDAWREGDKDAARQLLDRHYGPLDRFFRNKVGAEAADLVQRTMLVCVESRDRFRGEASFRTDLFAIARNELRAHVRGLGRGGGGGGREIDLKTRGRWPRYWAGCLMQARLPEG